MKMMEWRLRGIPAPLWRRVKSKAGEDMQRVLLGLLAAYADGKIDPLADRDPVATARGALGGQARASALTPERRSEIARHARAQRTDIPLRGAVVECARCHVAPAMGGSDVCAACAELPPAPGGDEAAS